MPSSDTPSVRRRMQPLLVGLLALQFSGACLAEQKVNDPLERLNRATYAFNDLLDRILVRPVAKGYKTVTPQPVRGAVSNFIANLYYPTTAVNQFLQGKIKDGFSDSARFIVNSTVGIGGLFDPATKFGLQAHDEDFGQTLGVWGVPAGPYLVLPLFGPSDFRDAPSKYVNTYTEVPRYFPRSWRVKGGFIVRGAYGIDQRAQLLGADTALSQAFDPYALLRDTYVRHREFLVRDGNVPPDEDDENLEPEPLPLAPPAPPRSTTPRGIPLGALETPDAPDDLAGPAATAP